MRLSLIIAVASAGLLAAPTLAQSHGGGGGGGGAGMGMGASGGGMPGGAMSMGVGIGSRGMSTPPGMDVRTEARADAQARLHANDRALERANGNSVLHDTRTLTSADMTTGSDHRTTARARAHGDEHASATALSKADANSALATSTSTRHRKRGHKSG